MARRPQPSKPSRPSRRRASATSRGARASRDSAASAPPATVGDLLAALDHLAPLRLAEEWDNVGLLVGDATAACSRVLLTIDATPAVMEEAIDLGVQAVVAYHPPLFLATRQLLAGAAGGPGAIAFEAARAGIALLSPHTALDNAANGVNDMLAFALGNGGRAPILPARHLPSEEAHRLVTHVPADAVDAVRDALARAGAGRIGEYTHCSFGAAGTGSFMGGEGSSPTIGVRGRLETVTEVRLEMPCASGSLASALAALRRAHPYEEPAIHVEAGVPRESATEGSGRIAILNKPATSDALAMRLRKMLGARATQVAATDRTRKHTVVGVCAGSGESLLDAAAARGATLFVTGELKHHDVLRAHAMGVDVILCGHTETERPYLPILAERLAPLLPGLDIGISHEDGAPLRSAKAR